mgnify:CR=1 FL=1
MTGMTGSPCSRLRVESALGSQPIWITFCPLGPGLRKYWPRSSIYQSRLCHILQFSHSILLNMVISVTTHLCISVFLCTSFTAVYIYILLQNCQQISNLVFYIIHMQFMQCSCRCDVSGLCRKTAVVLCMKHPKPGQLKSLGKIKVVTVSPF